MVFTSEFLLTSKTDNSTCNHSLMPIRHVRNSSQCQPSNGVSHALLASVPAELQAAMKIVFTGKSLLSLRTDTLTLSHSLMPIRHVPEFPRCQLSNGTSHAILASVPTELQAAMKIVFTGESLLTLKSDILMLSYSIAPLRHVPETPRCQRSNGASHILQALLPA
ncbi:hypothetical protein L873DRAFT_1795686 [Choiromyces venosus 120613-1]|uniref:Uncharacterized protein n=1 Tax=Choiromyces venosus 120613-1 TaxID=1336337 RepID=A0A3N4J0W5_9PEZI|nr:hypothetical protein L873DRAFT_1795686 [Choiromyces venosus 120613-1]